MCCWLRMSVCNDDHTFCIQMSLCVFVCPGRRLWILPSLKAPLHVRVCLRRHLHVLQLSNLKSMVLLQRDLLNISVLVTLVQYLSVLSCCQCLFFFFSFPLTWFCYVLSFPLCLLLSLSTFSVSLLRTCYLI